MVVHAHTKKNKWKQHTRFQDWKASLKRYRTTKKKSKPNKHPDNLCLKRGFCGETKDIPRRLMPQIYDPSAFAKRIRKDFGIRSRRVKVPVSKLQSSQNEINKDRVQDIVDKLEAKEQSITPIVISKDFYIVDGHHRWAAYKQWNPSLQIPALKLDLPIQDALGLAATLQKSRESF